MDKKFKVKWCYNERLHGKGPMDGIGSTIKNKGFRDVKSGKVHIKDVKSFADYADLASMFSNSRMILILHQRYLQL